MVSLEKELFLSCLRGDVSGVKYYLEKGANMNVICPTGRTPFGTAAQLGNVEILQVFLDNCKKYNKVKTESRLEMKYSFEKSVNKYKTKKNSKPQLDYLVNINSNEPSSLCCSGQNDINLNNGVENKYFELQNTMEKCNSKVETDLKLSMCKLDKTAYDLATFNDTFVRRDPRFKSVDWFSEKDLSWEEGDITPDGMDNLEWDTEVEGLKDSVPTEGEDPWCSLYFWYTGILLQTSALLEEKPPPNDINREDQFGCCALHYAAVESHADVARLLISAGCKVNIGDSDNLTPLHMAAARDSPEVVELLIEAGANVNYKTTDRISPLHVSASRGLLNNVKLLINAGAHIDTLDSSDRSPLFMAVSRSHVNVVQYLLERGAKVNLEEIHGYTPLSEAVWQKNTTIVKMLLDAGAKITQSHHLLHYAVLHRHKEMVSLLISAGSIMNLRDENGDTPLIVAAKTHQSDIARLLLVNGASINCRSYFNGNTPLHEAITNVPGESHKFQEIFSLLQEFDVDLEAESNAGFPALYDAINNKFDDAAAILIRHGADVNRLHSFHINLFFCVVNRGNRFLSELFIYAGYKVCNIIVPCEPTTPLEKWIAYIKINPLRLSDLCRINVRTRFKSKVYEKVSALDLPSAIKTFLKLEDINKIDFV